MIGLSGVGLLTSFGAGVVSFLSPCVLPLVPGYVSCLTGDALTASGEPAGKLATLRLSFCFVLGFSTVFVILGASATSPLAMARFGLCSILSRALGPRTFASASSG